MIFRSIDGRSEIDLLVSRSARREASARWVAGLLERGESRPQWCRMALSDDGELLAAHALDSWSLDHDPGDTPSFVHLLGHVDEAAAVALLEHDLHAFGAATVDARLVSDAEAPAEVRTQREGQQRVLEAAGFAVEVDRVRLHWAASPPESAGPGSRAVPHQPRPAGGLTFRRSGYGRARRARIRSGRRRCRIRQRDRDNRCHCQAFLNV